MDLQHVEKNKQGFFAEEYCRNMSEILPQHFC